MDIWPPCFCLLFIFISALGLARRSVRVHLELGLGPVMTHLGYILYVYIPYVLKGTQHLAVCLLS